MGTQTIQNQLDTFKKRIHSLMDAEDIILYGSYVRDEATEYSDVDIIVISRHFDTMTPDERFRLLYSITSDLHPDFQVHGATPKEMQKAGQFSTLKEAQRTGISVGIK